MKLSKKIRLIGLSAALVLLIAIGIGGGIWFFSRDTEEAPGPELSGVERAGLIQEGEIYQEELIWERPAQGIPNVNRYKEEAYLFGGDKEEIRLENLLTGETEAEIPTEWVADGDCVAAALNEQKDISILIKNANQQTEIKIYPNDSAKEGQTFFINDMEAYLQKMSLDKQYIYLNASFGSSVVLRVYDWEGKLCRQIERVAAFALASEGSFYVVDESYKLSLYDMSQTEPVFQQDINLYIPNGCWTVAFEPQQNLVYVGTQDKIQIFDGKTGDFIKTALDMQKSAPGIGNRYQDMWVDPQQNIYCAAPDHWGGRQQVKIQLFRYHIVEDFRKDMPYTLTVTSPYPTTYMASLIQKFEQNNPDQRVHYDCAYLSEREFLDHADQDGYFERFSAQILAGDVGDIVMTGGKWIDVYQYFANTDLFEDMSSWLKEIDCYQELDPVLLKAITIDEAVKGLPLATTYYYALVDEDLCRQLNIDLDWQSATWSDVLGLLDQLEGTDYYLFEVYGNTERAFVRMLISNMPDLIDRKDQSYDLRQQWFLDLIQQWKAAEEHPNFAKRNSSQLQTGKGLISIDGITKAHMEVDEVSSVWMTQQETGHKISICPLFCGEKASNRTALGEEMYSIYTGSENREKAWELLRLGMTEEMQSSNQLNHCGPINQKAREKRIDTAIFWNIEKNSLVERFYQQFQPIYENVDTLYDMSKIKENLYKTLWGYVQKGSKVSLEEVLAKAEQQLMVQLYE